MKNVFSIFIVGLVLACPGPASAQADQPGVGNLANVFIDQALGRLGGNTAIGSGVVGQIRPLAMSFGKEVVSILVADQQRKLTEKFSQAAQKQMAQLPQKADSGDLFKGLKNIFSQKNAASSSSTQTAGNWVSDLKNSLLDKGVSGYSDAVGRLTSGSAGDTAARTFVKSLSGFKLDTDMKNKLKELASSHFNQIRDIIASASNKP